MPNPRNAGRKSNYRELRVKELTDKAINWAIENFDSFTPGQKMDVLKHFGPKFIPQEVNFEGEIEVKVTEVPLNERMELLNRINAN